MEGRSILATLSALSSLLSFPPTNLFWLSYICLIPLLISIQNAPNKQAAFKQGLIYGMLFMGGFHLWLFKLDAWGPLVGIFFLWLALTLYLSVFYGFAALAIHHFKKHPWLIPIIWTTVEWIKTQTILGNPAGSLGYSFGFHPLLAQLAAIGGIFLLTFLITTINTLCVTAYNKKTVTPLFPILLLLIIQIVFGHYHLQNNITPTTKIAVIQPNHLQERKLNKREWMNLRMDYAKIAKNIVKQHQPEFVFMPETITPGLNLTRAEITVPLQFLAEKSNTTFIFGTPEKSNNHYFNSIATITNSGIEKTTYRKKQLMPFGEYWPGKKIFKALGFNNLIPGSEFTHALHLNQLTLPHNIILGPTICLESLYPRFSRHHVNQGANVLFAAVNNAWFFGSTAAEKHLQMSILRAIENNRYFIQAANTGISAIIDNKGQRISQSNLNEKTTLIGTIAPIQTKTLYTKIGEWWLLISLVIGLLILKLKK